MLASDIFVTNTTVTWIILYKLHIHSIPVSQYLFHGNNWPLFAVLWAKPSVIYTQQKSYYGQRMARFYVYRKKPFYSWHVGVIILPATMINLVLEKKLVLNSHSLKHNDLLSSAGARITNTICPDPRYKTRHLVCIFGDFHLVYKNTPSVLQQTNDICRHTQYI